MKAIAIVLVAAAITVAPMAVQNAHAQFELTVGGGVNSPLGEFADQADLGYAVMTGAGYRLTPFLVLGAEISLYGNSGSDELLSGLSPGTEVSTRIMQYAGMAKVLIPFGSHNLFAKGLIGNYRASAKVTGPLGVAEGKNSETGYGLGGGLLIGGAGRSSFFLDMTYHTIAFDGATENTNFVTYTAGAVFTLP